MINVGFVGCGRIADLHQRGYVNHPEARLYALCDTDPDLLEARRRAWGVERTYTDYRDLLADPELHAVEVLVPYDRHEEVVCAAARAGKHVACQKPMTTDLASADRMIAAATAAGIVFKVTEIYTTYPPIRKAKEMIDAGAIGEPLGLRIHFVSGPHGGWEVSPRTYTDQVRVAGRGLGLQTFDHGHHEWATAWYLLGPPDCVTAWVESINGVLDNPAAAMWSCKGGNRWGVIDYMFGPDLRVPSQYYSNDELYQITGSKGIIMVNRGTGELFDLPPVSLYDNEKWTHFHDIETDWGMGFVHATHNFIRAIQGKEAPLLTGEQGREVLRFGLGVTVSARKRREVYLEELDRRWPWLHAWRRRREARRRCAVHPRRKARGGRHERYAPRARELTLALPDRFDGAAAGEWACAIALYLEGTEAVSAQRFALDIRDGSLCVTPDTVPENPDLTLRMTAGVWAAMLLGKKRIEMALVQGLIRYEGQVEKALPLRNAFRI